VRGGDNTGDEVAAEAEVGAVAGGEREEAGKEREACERAVETGERRGERANLRGHDWYEYYDSARHWVGFNFVRVLGERERER
jgi:hypothetical protein